MVAVVGDNEFDDIIDTLTIKLYNSSISTQRFYNESDFSNYYGQNYSGINFAVVFTNISSGNVSYTIRPSLDLGLPDLSTLYATEGERLTVATASHATLDTRPQVFCLLISDMCHPKWDDDPSVFQSNEMKCNCPARKYYDAGFILLQTLVDTSIYKVKLEGYRDQSDRLLSNGQFLSHGASVIFPDHTFLSTDSSWTRCIAQYDRGGVP